MNRRGIRLSLDNYQEVADYLGYAPQSVWGNLKYDNEDLSHIEGYLIELENGHNEVVKIGEYIIKINGVIYKMEKEDIRAYNVGNSDYAKHKVQPWDIWEEYRLNPWDADIVKRVLRKKEGESRKMDYEKIIHICKKRIEQIDRGIEL